MGHDHNAILAKVRQELPADELLSDLSDLFKIFGDTTRCSDDHVRTIIAQGFEHLIEDYEREETT